MKKEKQSWTDYVPHSVSLYYVDYRENLDSHDDLQEQCIRRNSLGPLEEQILEWYADQEHDNLQGYLSRYGMRWKRTGNPPNISDMRRR